MLVTLVDFYQRACDDKPCAKVVLAPDTPASLIVSGVEPRLVQVMQNLISNALSFAPLGSEVVVSVHVTKDRYVDLIVEDEGGGIPEAKLEAIFDRFYSERPKDEKFGTHSGLGLSISKQIVEAHHGQIWAENRLGPDGQVIGARFTVRLPGGGED